MVREVRRLERRVGLGSARQVLRASRGRIAAAIIRRGHYQKRDSVGLGNRQTGSGDLHLAAFVDRAKHAAELHPGLFELVRFDLLRLGTLSRINPEIRMRNRLARKDDAVRRRRHALAVLRARQRCVERYLGWLIAGDANDDHLIRRGGKHLSRKGRIADLVSDAHDTRCEVKLPAVVGGVVVPGELEIQISQRLIGRLAIWNAHHRFVFQRLRLAGLAFEQQAADLRQRLKRLRINALALLAVPDGIFVELNILFRRPAKDHGAQPAIADGQPVGPCLGRVLVPKHGVGGGERRRSG